MKKVLTFLLMFLFSLSMLAQEKPKTKFTYGGVYTAWAQSQHAFRFNSDTYDDDYVVQMFRLKLGFSPNEYLKAITRFDIAQGWWGVDNARRSVQRTATTGSGSALFDFKDTNYLFHVDQAYILFKIPNSPLTGRIGRMWYGLGNKMMVDNNYDGVQFDLNNVIGKKVTLSWARVSEGLDGLTDLDSAAADRYGNSDGRDADLFMLDFNNKAGGLAYNVYGMYYKDRSVNDMNAYVPDHLQFFKTRFSPQVTQLTAVGFAGTYKTDKLKVKGEFDYLTGKDDIQNTTHGAKQMWDINNGDLSGYNLYLNGTLTVTPAVSLGAVIGRGSGDDDLTGGKGNVNKLRTSGFFYITEVWEDSIMPDEEGITPQGLGAPNVRGYRELENTTALQLNATLKPVDKLNLFASFTLLKATEPIHAWSTVADSLGNIVDAAIDPAVSADDIGSEIDFKISYNMYKPLNFTLRGGYFIPGDAAEYLINGKLAANADPAWELKGTVALKF